MRLIKIVDYKGTGSEVGNIAEHMKGTAAAVAVGNTVVVAYIVVANTVGRCIAVEHTVVAASIVLELMRKLERQTMNWGHIVAAAVTVVGIAIVGMDWSEVVHLQLVVGSMACVVCHRSRVTGSKALAELAFQCTG